MNMGGYVFFCLKSPFTDNAIGISDPSYGSFEYENTKDQNKRHDSQKKPTTN